MKNLIRFTKNKYLLSYDFLLAGLGLIFTKIFLNAKIHSFTDVFTVKTSFDVEDLYYLLCTFFIYFAAIYISKSHQVMWLHAGTKNYLTLICSLFISTLINIVMSRIFFTGERFAILFNLYFFLWVICSRMAVRGINKILKTRKHLKKATLTKNVLIIGAGDGGTILLHDLTTNTTSEIHHNVVGFLDHNASKKNTYIEDVRVLGSLDIIDKVCKDYLVDEIHLAIPSLSAKQRTEILNKCNKTGCKLKIMVSPENALVDGSEKFVSRDVQIEDLLDREPITLDNSAIEMDIKNKVVMVTGGGGSIGSELCRQIAKYSPAHLVVFDIYENNAYDLQMQLKDLFPELNLSVIIGSVRDYNRLDKTISELKPHIIFHAAAHKHVPLMEDSPSEAIKNNCFGTYNLVKLASLHKVSKFVMISTDKAVNPTNVMGATKRMCEMIVQAMDKESETKFVAVRFGNVLGSNGSVIPLFKRQIAKGGPVTVTHKDITRFFMTIPEASQLVIQAASHAKGGEIFVLDMGSPVRIYDLAENLIRLSGYVPNVDIPIKITGLRPGEKLYEELLMSEEGLTDTPYKSIFIGKPSDITLEDVAEKLSKLKDAIDKDNPEIIRTVLKEVVPTYNPANQ